MAIQEKNGYTFFRTDSISSAVSPASGRGCDEEFIPAVCNVPGRACLFLNDQAVTIRSSIG